MYAPCIQAGIFVCSFIFISLLPRAESGIYRYSTYMICWISESIRLQKAANLKVEQNYSCVSHSLADRMSYFIPASYFNCFGKSKSKDFEILVSFLVASNYLQLLHTLYVSVSFFLIFFTRGSWTYPTCSDSFHEERKQHMQTQRGIKAKLSWTQRCFLCWTF